MRRKPPRPLAVVGVTSQAPGAWPNGSTVRKVNSQPGDATANGVHGRVLGSLDARQAHRGASVFVYFVTWEAGPAKGLPVFVGDHNDNGTERLELVRAAGGH